VLPFCSPLAYCLMPNHFHFLFHFDSDEQIERFKTTFSKLLSSYTRAFNNRYNRTGSLFQTRTKSKCLNGEQAFCCFHYIHQNPVKARLTRNFEDWPFSSYNDYCGLRNNLLVAKANANQLLDIPESKEMFIRQSKDVVVNEIVLKSLLQPAEP
jgi:putative transposase